MDDYATLLDVPIDDLLADLGRAVAPDLLGTRAFREAVAAGRAWLAGHTPSIQDRVCPDYERLTSAPRPVDVVAGIADLLASIEGMPSVATLAVLIYRFGLANFCREYAA